MNRLKKRIINLESAIKTLEYYKKYNNFYSDESTEKAIVNKIACGVVGHTFGLRYAFINRKKDNIRYGKFECINCYLKIERPLTDKEKTAAESLGMLS